VANTPFDGAEFADNPEPRCPCILLLDTSGSMAGAPIDQLNEGLRTFDSEIRSQSLAAQRVEIAIVSFGPVKTELDFCSAADFQPPLLTADDGTPMGKAILHSIQMLRERKDRYKANRISYYRPWIFLITDAQSTDDLTAAKNAIQEGERRKELMFFAVGVESADMSILSDLSVRDALKLKGLAFAELFSWLSNSLGSVSRSDPSDEPELDNPTAPRGWAVAGG
jgi:uncharacterized protein YegL